MRADKNTSRRLWLLEALLLAWGLVVLARLFSLQAVEHRWLAAKAERQQSRTLDVTAPRGMIYGGKLHPLAMSLEVDSVFAVPARIAQPRRTAAKLAQVLHLDASDLEAKLSTSRNFCWVARKVTAEQSRRVRALHLAGVYFQKEPRRFYPKGKLGAQVLGYVGMDGHGLGGLELEFDHDLQGQPGRLLMEVDAHGETYSRVEQAPEAGENLILTLDQNVEYIAQHELDLAMAATHARRGSAIVLVPRTGAVLAIADAPTFDPNDYSSTPQRDMTDAAISDVYEPGSVFKLVTVSAALQAGLARPDELINCQMGSIKVGGRVIHDHARYGLLTVAQILQHSSDIGAIKLGLRLGDQRLYRYIRAYGFGQPTGIDLPAESRGLLRPPQRWTPMSIGAISMGQEIAVTPLQMAAMVATLADGGVYHAPYVVADQVHGAPPAVLPSREVAGQRVVSPEVANEMKMMMEQVVLAGTGTEARLAGYTAAGKTGTAQKVDPGTHAYSSKHYVASFAGFAPLRVPAIAILVMLDSPVGRHTGGEVAAPVFRRIAEQVLPYLGVPHDVPLTPPLERASGEQPTPPPATAVPLPAPPPAAAPSGDTVVLDYGDSLKVPDFHGRSVRAVADLCQSLGLDPALEGDGVAVRQQPPAGARVPSDARVTVWFQGGG